MTVRITKDVDGVHGTTLYERLDESGVPVEGPRVVLQAVVHGNEHVGIWVFEELLPHIEACLTRGSVLTVVANQVAYAANQRHTATGSDMNRMFDPDSLAAIVEMPERDRSYEQRRALELAPVLSQCDVILDLHSTSQPAAPFLLFRDDQRHAAIARVLGVQNLVTGIHESGLLPGGIAANVGLLPGERGKHIGFTYEAGQHTDRTNGARGWEVVQRLLHHLEMWSEQPPATDVRPRVYECIDRFPQASGDERYEFIRTGDPEFTISRLLESFEEVHADEVLLRQRGTVVRATSPFTMLMPAPTAAPGADLFYYAQRRYGGLSVGKPRTTDEARLEASAVERMMDLLADDELARGNTWVSFESRRTLDVCADIIGRGIRLPLDHPHRKLSVVGRGDWGGSELERRAGQRYRHAMRKAIEAGVPVHRFQLMRGAALGWLDALTSSAMLGLIRKRGSAGIKLRLSLRHPHTVSMLVLGDLRKALEEGDTRYCRVALLIEAARVAPVNDSAEVRVVRLGLVSQREQILRAALGMLDDLEAEHRALIRGGLFDREALDALVQPDGSIQAVPSTELISRLRMSLCRLQIRTWRDAMGSEHLSAVRLHTPAAVGRWLAQFMTRTGILDAQTLRQLVIRSDGDHWVADPGAIIELAERPEYDVLRRLLTPLRRRPSPQQPVLAREVDGDSVERWIGWKRHIRNVESIPSSRGKDLDVLFHKRAISSRAARWLQDAMARARERPGDVLVVMAGDGLSPSREGSDGSRELLAAHRALLLDPNTRYLRIQHASSTHFSWMKDLVDTLGRRPAGAPVGLQFEAEHGASVNVLLVAERRERSVRQRVWSLDGWRIRAAGVVVSDTDADGGDKPDYRVGLFTEEWTEIQLGANLELIHFARSHCEGLMKQSGWRVRGERGAPRREAIDRIVQAQLERWIKQVRALSHDPLVPLPVEVQARTGWIARRLGIADPRLAHALAVEMERTTPVDQAAESLWLQHPAWPGPAFDDPKALGAK